MILSYSFWTGDWIPKIKENKIRNLLIRGKIHAHEEFKINENGIDSDSIVPVLFFAKKISLSNLNRRIEISPFWFLYSIDDAITNITLICVACSSEFNLKLNVKDVKSKCPICSFSQAALRNTNPNIGEIEEYITNALNSVREYCESKFDFLKIIQRYIENDFTLDEKIKIPTDRFSGTLKQINLKTANNEFIEIFDEAFGQFKENSYPSHIDKYPDIDKIEEIIIGANFFKKSKGRYRRYSGGPDLPRERYYSVCVSNNGHDNHTLTAELLSYSSPEIGAYPALYDSTNVKISDEILQFVGNECFINPLEPVLIILFIQQSLTGNFIEDIKNSVGLIACNLKVVNTTIDNVLDLRFAKSQCFLATAVSQLQRLTADGETEVDSIKNKMTVQTPNFGLDNIYQFNDDFLKFMGTMINPIKGGGEFNDAIGRFLRSCGYNGLIYPSARRDCSTFKDIDNEIYYDGWNFVDYRNSIDVNLTSEDITMFRMEYNGKQPQKKVYGIYHESKYIFSSGFYIMGAEKRDADISLKIGPEI